MLRLRFFSLNMENIEVKRSILFQIPYFRKLVVKKLRVYLSHSQLSYNLEKKKCKVTYLNWKANRKEHTE